MWLAYHKQKWKLQRIRRHEKKQQLMGLGSGRGGMTEDHTSSSRGVRSHNLAGFFQQQNRALVELPWQIIQVHVQEFTRC